MKGRCRDFVLIQEPTGPAFTATRPTPISTLREKGLEYIFPDESEAMIFDNDTCLVGYSALKVVDPLTGRTEVSHENLQKTLNEIGRFSKRDADTAEELFRRYLERWKSAFGKYRLSPPVPWGEKNELEKLCDDPKDGFDPIYQFMTSQQLAYDAFRKRRAEDIVHPCPYDLLWRRTG